ncbi:hypothetical protein BDN72DRAFT_583951 [Pluteus cervinus]|uniref:Uncharacterized protein n=1 Tax=Pluteus cervinus TaxID=181527 RepID=A0ACD3AVY9_9AGAR|nr:hypothetical protein BDN72DRAFT_583951 [Pluteus cervinus]
MLKSLKFHDQAASRRPFPSATFQPLCKLSQLECLHLDVPFALELSDSRFFEWGAAWSLLKDIQLGGERSSPSSSCLSPQDLAHIAGLWPHLESLCVSLDLRELSMEWLEGIRGHLSLKSLHVHGSCDQESSAILAIFVSMLFPRLQVFRFSGKTRLSFRPEVPPLDPQRQLAFHSMVRKQEREYCPRH